MGELTIELAHAGEVLVEDLLGRARERCVRADAAQLAVWAHRLVGVRAHVFPHLQRQARAASPPDAAVLALASARRRPGARPHAACKRRCA